MADNPPEPVIGLIRYLYSSYTFAVNIRNIESLIEDYHRFINDPNTCLGNFSDQPCRPCIDQCLSNIAKILTDVFSMGPSSKMSEEFDDFRKLSQLAKKFLQMEGRMGHFIYVLMNRKCASLEGSRHAKMMRRMYLQEARGITEERERVGQQIMEESWQMRRLVRRFNRAPQDHSIFLRSIRGREISSLPQLMVAVQETFAVEERVMSPGSDEEHQAFSEGSEASTISMTDRSVVENASDESVHSSSAQTLANGTSDDESEEVPSNAIDNKPLENPASPPQRSRRLDFNIFEREPSEVRMPAPPALPTRSVTGMMFDVVERESTGIRAPGPPMWRR
ncbi:MAG: hypothetical protein Q9224_006441 [Gallowayella concinna]